MESLINMLRIPLPSGRGGEASLVTLGHFISMPATGPVSEMIQCTRLDLANPLLQVRVVDHSSWV